MTTPTIVPVQYDAADTDYLKVKSDRSGATRINAGQVTVPASTVSGSTVGLVPFNRGERFTIGDKSIHITDADTSTNVTATVGYIYDDNTTYTNNLVAWVSAATTPQAGGFFTVNNPSGLSFVSEADGWVVVQITGATTTTAATVSYQIPGAYDGTGINNQNSQAN